jgi:general secretion pathway protein G
MKELYKNSFGFTLVELLVVISIISVLVSVVAVSFRSSQAKGRDAERKNDLKQIAGALELYYSDYGKYPDASNGQIVGCGGAPCSWGSGTFTDGKTVYFKVMPKDPSVGYSFFYRIVDSPTNQKFQLFARLENNQDQSCLGGNCASPPVSYLCGSAVCNFAITSPNTTPTE